MLGSDADSRSPSEEPNTIPTHSKNNNPIKPRPRTIMNGHHIKYIATYSGQQPADSEARVVPLRGWKKYIWERQTYKIIANKHSLEITLEYDGSLDSVKEKLDYCQEMADRIGRVFVKRHNIVLESPFTLSPHSHWVVEHRRTGDMLKPLVHKPGNERVGGIYGDSSHPDKLEFIGRDSVNGAVGMDGLLIDLPTMLEAWNKGQTEWRQDIKTVLAVMAELLKEMRGGLKK